MSLTIIGSQTSPFARIIRALCLELDLEHTLQALPPTPKMTQEDKDYLRESNPLLRVPVLIDNGQTVFDSRIMAYHLMQKSHKNPSFTFPLDLAHENLVTIIYGVIDAGVIRFILGNEGQDLNTGYMKKSYDRMGFALDWLDRQPLAPQDFGFYQLSLICGLEWLEKRKLFDWHSYKNLAEIVEVHKNRDSLVQTRIPENI